MVYDHTEQDLNTAHAAVLQTPTPNTLYVRCMNDQTSSPMILRKQSATLCVHWVLAAWPDRMKPGRESGAYSSCVWQGCTWSRGIGKAQIMNKNVDKDVSIEVFIMDGIKDIWPDRHAAPKICWHPYMLKFGWSGQWYTGSPTTMPKKA